MQSDLKRVLFSKEEIDARLDQLAVQITEDYRGKDLTVLAILNGSLISCPTSFVGFRSHWS